MGIENNNAIIATTWNENELKKIKKWVDAIQDNLWRNLFLFSDKVINGLYTVVMVPDGSKEGWPESDHGDKLRNEFINLLEEADHNDGSSPWDFVEIGYGEFGQTVLRGNCKNCYDDAEYYDGKP